MRFKVGDYIKRGPSKTTTWISGIIVSYTDHDYNIKVTSKYGNLDRRISQEFIDRYWHLDENSVIDKLLEKYKN